MHVEVHSQSGYGEHANNVLAFPPRTFGECQTRGLGTTTPCPWARCRHSLLCDIAPPSPKNQTEVHETIDLSDDSNEILERPTCSLAVATGGQVEPERIAELLRISLGLQELIQRHALLKVAAALNRVRDLRRGVSLDVEALPDGRGPATKRTPHPPRRPRRPAPPAPSERMNNTDFRGQLDHWLERLRRDGKPWRKLTRTEAAAIYGAALHPNYGRTKPASSDEAADALPTQPATGTARKGALLRGHSLAKVAENETNSRKA
jgi:hypothetical protein